MIFREHKTGRKQSRKFLFTAPYGSRFHGGEMPNNRRDQIVPPPGYQFNWRLHNLPAFPSIHFSYVKSMWLVRHDG